MTPDFGHGAIAGDGGAAPHFADLAESVASTGIELRIRGATTRQRVALIKDTASVKLRP